ncbi:MAG: hypothetical protein RL250_493 [Verrucomicrobiota bacterium]
MPPRPRLLPLTAALALATATVPAQNHEPFEDPPINYSATQPVDQVSRLNAAAAKQAEEIRSWPARRRLRWLLEQLNVPVESQLLVFSKTSLQRALIAPLNPRALYFSDEAYVGWVPGGAMELTVFDPVLGATFYIVDATQPETAPLIARSNECLSCHAHHDHTPSLRARSIFPDLAGEPLSGSGASNIDPSTPLEERWGGWYVTGRTPGLRHRGNVLGKTTEEFTGDNPLRGEVRPGLPAGPDAARYPRPTSDIVALLMHDHQVHVHNVLCTANQEARIALYRWPAMRELLQLPADSAPAGSCLVVLNSQAEKVLEALLCKGEAAFPAGGVQGDGAFEQAYAATRRPDGQDRALRDLDLRTRLFKYRCSPLIYARTFAAMPKELRTVVLRRLSVGLLAAAPGPEFAHLPADERKAIHEILTATLPDLPADWGK